MPPPAKRQKKESAGSGTLREDESGQSCAAVGPAKAAASKSQRKNRAHGTLLKDEWCGLSKSAQSRHVKNEIRARIGAMIPGPGKVSENGLMLQAASRIKELEIEIDSASNYLGRLQKLQSCGENTIDKSNDQSVAAVVPVVHESKDGPEVLRAILPQPTKAKGKKLLESAWQYLTELQQELKQVVFQIEDHQVGMEAQDPTCGK